MTLRHKIEQEIRKRGPIPFSRYMELCLYDHELGYYSRGADQFGKAGDFYTSSDVHAVFGRLWSRQFEEMWRVLGSPAEINLVELGPGRGLFAQDVLDWSHKKFPIFFNALRYLMVERSPALRQKIQSTLTKHLSGGKASLMPEGLESKDGVVSDILLQKIRTLTAPVVLFANEFFDALPVEILSAQGALRIAEHGGRLLEGWAEASPEELEYLDRYSVHPEPGERIEVALTAQRYFSEVAGALKRGFIVAVDYGYTREEQLAGAHRGTLSTFRKHSAGSNPYEAPGEQDLSAQVNFTALAAAAKRQGMQVHPLMTQSQCLMGIGEQNQFADAFEECRLPQERAKVALQLKHLVTPAGMGESFRVLTASKGVSQEQLAALSGLNFANSRR